MRPRRGRNAAEVRPKCSRGLAEVQPRCGRGAAEVRPRCSQDLDDVYGRGLAPTIGRVSVLVPRLSFRARACKPRGVDCSEATRDSGGCCAVYLTACTTGGDPTAAWPYRSRKSTTQTATTLARKTMIAYAVEIAT